MTENCFKEFKTNPLIFVIFTCLNLARRFRIDKSELEKCQEADLI